MLLVTSLVLILIYHITVNVFLLTAFIQFPIPLPPASGDHKSDLFLYESVCLLRYSWPTILIPGAQHNGSIFLYVTKWSPLVVLVYKPTSRDWELCSKCLPIPELSLFKNDCLSNAYDINFDCCLISISLILAKPRINFTCLWASQGPSSENFWFIFTRLSPIVFMYSRPNYFFHSVL